LKKHIGEIGLIITAIIWGSGFVATQIAIDSNLTPNQILTLRFFVSSILMNIVFFKNMKKIDKATIKSGMILGIFLFIGFVFQTYGLVYTTLSKNAFITAANVVIVPFIGFLIYKRKLDKIGVISSIVAIIGIGVLSLEADFSLNLGDILTFICAVGFALQIFFTGEFTKDKDPIALTSIQISTAFVLSFMLLLITKEVNVEMSVGGIGSTIYLAIFNTTVCFLLQTICQTKTSETKAALILSTESIFGTIFSVIILHEIITLKMILGCSLIFFAIIMSETKLSFLKKDKGMARAEILDENTQILKTLNHSVAVAKTKSDEISN
jgi:drug/metabolite transporter (DMT)-like permease